MTYRRTLRGILERIGLRLPGDLEEAFQADYFERSIRHVRLGIASGLALYAIFGVLDRWIVPEALGNVMLIRFGVVIPIGALLFLFTYSPAFRRFMQAALTLFLITAGSGIIAMTLISSPPGSVYYYAGLLVVIQYAFTVSRANFLNSCLASWLLVGLYNTGQSAAVPPLPAGVLLNNNFFLVASGLLGMLAKYHTERYIRRDFIQAGVVREKDLLDKAMARVETSLRESEAKFKALSETTGAAIFIHQGEKLVYANPAGVSMTGYAREDLLAMNFWHLVHPDWRDLVLQRAKARLEGADLPAQYEIKYINRSGAERWAILSAGLIRYEGRPAVIGTLFDITDLKQAEEEKARLYDDNMRASLKLLAEQKRNVREKEKMIRDLHDGLGGSIMNIGALSQVASAQAGSEPVRKTLAAIGALASDGLVEIRMLMQSLDVADVSWSSLAAMLRQHGAALTEPHGIEFTMETVIDAAVPSPGSLVYLNVFRIFRESLTNVVKHAGARNVFAFMRAGSGRVRLTVQDDGRGLGEGSGRGMPSMRKRAEEIGGSLVITSGSGTLVVFELDLHMPQKSPSGVMETGGESR